MDIRNETGPFGQFAPRGIVARLLDATRKAAPTWAGRRMGFLFRKLAIRQLHGQPLDVETFGARMRLYHYTTVSAKRVLFTPQFFDA